MCSRKLTILILMILSSLNLLYAQNRTLDYLLSDNSFLYLQNFTLNNGEFIDLKFRPSHLLKIGSNVTNLTNVGKVELKSGSFCNLCVSYGSRLYPEIIVNQGAKLKLYYADIAVGIDKGGYFEHPYLVYDGDQNGAVLGDTHLGFHDFKTNDVFRIVDEMNSLDLYHGGLYNSGNRVMSIADNGCVAFNNGSSSVNKLNVGGDILADRFLTSSDSRLKKNIHNITDSKYKLFLLKGKSYNKVRTQSESIEEYGFIAQDVETVFPELVSTDVDGYKSVNYLGILPVIVEALKEQVTMVERNNEKIEELSMLVKRRNDSNTGKGKFWVVVNDNMAKFKFKLSQSNSQIKVVISVYNILTGSHVWRYEEYANSDIFQKREITWDFKNAMGSSLQPGYYLCNADVEICGKIYTIGSQKIRYK